MTPPLSSLRCFCGGQGQSAEMPAWPRLCFTCRPAAQGAVSLWHPERLPVRCLPRGMARLAGSGSQEPSQLLRKLRRAPGGWDKAVPGLLAGGGKAGCSAPGGCWHSLAQSDSAPKLHSPPEIAWRREPRALVSISYSPRQQRWAALPARGGCVCTGGYFRGCCSGAAAGWALLPGDFACRG